MLNQLLNWQNLLDVVWLMFLLFLFAYFWNIHREFRQTQYWPKAQGYITYCKWTVEGHRLWPKIEYLYHIGERDFLSENVFLDSSHHDPNSKHARKIAFKIAKAYQEDAPIDVYYNPQKPEQAVLDNHVPGKLNLILILITTFMILHIGLVIWRLFG